MLSDKKICLFGGTFDPIHEGHIEIMKLAKKALDLDKVILIPCYQSPHKIGKKAAEAIHRIEMCRRSVSDLDWVEVSD